MNIFAKKKKKKSHVTLKHCAILNQHATLQDIRAVPSLLTTDPTVFGVMSVLHYK